MPPNSTPVASRPSSHRRAATAASRPLAKTGTTLGRPRPWAMPSGATSSPPTRPGAVAAKTVGQAQARADGAPLGPPGRPGALAAEAGGRPARVASDAQDVAPGRAKPAAQLHREQQVGLLAVRVAATCPVGFAWSQVLQRRGGG